MPPTILAPRSRIPTLKSRTKQTSSGTAGSQSTKAPAAEGSANTGSLTKKRGSATLLNTLHVSPNPKARKISRTNDEVATPPSSKRPRATSPVPPSSTRKRPRKSNHPTDFDYVPSTNGQRLTTPTPRRVTRQSLAAEEENLEEDPLDCLTGPGALDTSGDSPQHSARARSTTGFDFTLNGSGLMEGADVEISSGGLYSDLDEDENEQAETSIARMAGMGSTGKGGKRGSPAPRETTRPRASAASVPRQTSTTPRRPSQSSNTSRRPSRSPNVSRRTSTSTTRQTSATPRRQSTTPTPRRRTEPKTLPPPVLTLTAAQTRKEARLAAAQAEAEAKLRASLESDLSRLSVVGEEEEEGEGDGTIDQGAEEGAAEEEEWQDKDSEGEESDDPLAGASVYQSPRQSPRAANSLTTTPQTRKTPGTRKTTVTPGNKSKKLTPRTKSTSKRATPRVRWTPRSSGKRSVQSKSGLEHESRNEDGGSDVDVSSISTRTRSSTAASRRPSVADTSRRDSGPGDTSVGGQLEEEPGGSHPETSRGRDRSRGEDQDEERSRSASRARSEAGSRMQSRGSPVARGRSSTSSARGRSSTSGSAPRRGNASMERNASSVLSRTSSSISVLGEVSRLNASVVFQEEPSIRQDGPRPKPTSANKSPMRVEVVLPAPPRRLSTGKPVSPQRPVETIQQPTPDPSSLDRSPGLEFGSNEDGEEIASGDSTYVPSSQHSDDDESPVDRPRDGHGRFMAQTPGSVSTSLARVRPDPPPSGSSVSLGSFHFEKPQRKRRASGFKPSGLGKVSEGGSRQADATQDGDRQHTVVGEVEPATERSIAEQRDKTVLQGRSALQTPSLNTVTPRVTVGSTPHHAFDFTPGSGFASRFESSFRPTGSYAQSTPYVRGDRQPLFGQSNQSGMPTGPLDLDLDGGSSEALGGRIPYSAKGKARDEGERNEIVPESSQPPNPLRYREISVDSSVIVSMSSPGKSLRTERLPTPRAVRISAAVEEDSDEEPDDPDPPSSPSANRQSLSGSIKGRGLSSILELRKQAWNQSNLPQDASSREMTTRLDAASQEVLDSPLSHTASSWPEAPTSATTVTSAGSGEPSKSLQAQPHPAPGLQSYNEADEEEMIVRASVSEDYPFDKQSIHLPHSDGLVPHDYDASVHFDGPSRAPIRRSATPILRGRLSPGEHTDSDIEPDELEEPPLADLVQRGRSSSISADSSGPDDVEEQELIEDGEPEQGRDDPLPIRTNASVLGSRHARDALSQAGYVGHEQSTLRFAPSPSSSARSTSRSLSRPRDYYGPNRSGRLDRSTSVGDRTTGLSRSQMMAEASMHEDWEPPARRQLKPRKWTDHDWRMLAHYLRRVQKSQALAKGLSSREELDLMMVNVHAVVNRFVEEEAHGIKLEGEWARSEITGRAVYLIIKEQHKKDGTWKSTALGDPSFSTILADMTRPRAPSEDQEEDLSGEPVLPAALSELPARSRAAASHLLAGPANNTTEAESDGHVSGTADEDEDESGDEGLDPRDAPLRNKPSSPEKRSPKRSPIRPNVQITVMHQRTQELRGVRNVPNATVSDYSSFVDQTRQTTPSTTFSRLIGSLSSIIGGRSLAQTTEPPTSFPTLKPSSHNQIDLTHLDDELSFPTLNHVPTPARPTPARPKRQIRVEPKINLPTLQHISPARPVELSRSPRKRIRRTASVRELAMSFEKMGEENRQAAEAARSRVGYGRSVSGPVGGSRSMTNESPGLTEVSNNIPQPVTLRTSPQRAAAQQVLKDEVEVIEISDTSTTTRGSVDL